jgi:hypothetical protein
VDVSNNRAAAPITTFLFDRAFARIEKIDEAARQNQAVKCRRRRTTRQCAKTDVEPTLANYCYPASASVDFQH